MTLAEIPRKQPCCVLHVGGQRAFRRRLMELGFVPGAEIELVNVAPLGDPLEVLVRGSRMSIRRAEAAVLEVAPRGAP